MNIKEITLKSKRDIESQTYLTLSKYLGDGQVTALDYKTLTLTEIEVINDFNYLMTIKDTFDNSDIEFIFNVFKLNNGLYILYIRHDFNYCIEIKEKDQEVKEKFTWFIQMMIEFHKDALISKRGSY